MIMFLHQNTTFFRLGLGFAVKCGIERASGKNQKISAEKEELV
jgi:hypothetical protein